MTEVKWSAVLYKYRFSGLMVRRGVNVSVLQAGPKREYAALLYLHKHLWKMDALCIQLGTSGLSVLLGQLRLQS